MHAIEIVLMAAFAAGAQPEGNDEAAVQDAIREALVAQGAQVANVEMRSVDADNMSGFADVRDPEGHFGRLACSASRRGSEPFSFHCLPAITDDMVREMEAIISAELARQGEVIEVRLSRVDDSHMTGMARLRADGVEVRAACTATRRNPAERAFDWTCESEE